MPVADLSRRERQLMRILLRRGKASVAEVVADLDDPPGYDAVRTTLRILEEKGHARHERQGQRYVYLPVASRERALREEIGQLIRTFFDGSHDRAAMALLRLSRSEASEKALRELEARLEEPEEDDRK
jgi:predicted transcriptional regulator